MLFSIRRILVAMAVMVPLVSGGNLRADIVTEQIFAFGNSTSGAITVSNSGPTTEVKGVDVSVQITNIVGIPVTIPATVNFDLVFTSGPAGNEQYAGDFSLTGPGFNYLTVVPPGGLTNFTGVFNGTSLSFDSQNTSPTFTTDIPTLPTLPPTDLLFSLNFSKAVTATATGFTLADHTKITFGTGSAQGSFNQQNVPEPSSLGLMGIGIVALAVRFRRRTIGV